MRISNNRKPVIHPVLLSKLFIFPPVPPTVSELCSVPVEANSRVIRSFGGSYCSTAFHVLSGLNSVIAFAVSSVVLPKSFS